ncbi:dynein axonemal heavy chain 6-like [Brachyhypopomus gauderio]|uniref:dynein axonemal heavy chain 6-like n=1 Tax=Brachyhypopomus gauderio TaxID=698409 RepID=UPI0040437C5B
MFPQISSRCPAASARRDARLPVAETPASLSFSLPPVDLERLRARLISTGPRPVQRGPDELVFTSSMWALQQERRRAAQRPVQPDILPALTRYQERNHPDYIHKMNREKLISAGWKPPSSSPAGHKRTDLSLENRSSDLQLPPLPEHLRETQVQRGQRIFSSASPLKKPRSATKHHTSISHTPSPPPNPLLFNSVEEVIRAQIHSPIEIGQVIRNNSHLGFLYMISAEPKSSVKYDPYNFKIVTYKRVKQLAEFYTVSAHGVTHHDGGHVDFVSLEQWVREYRLHLQLLRIPFVALFRKRKAFCVWRDKVQARKMVQTQDTAAPLHPPQGVRVCESSTMRNKT